MTTSVLKKGDSEPIESSRITPALLYQECESLLEIYGIHTSAGEKDLVCFHLNEWRESHDVPDLAIVLKGEQHIGDLYILEINPNRLEEGDISISCRTIGGGSGGGNCALLIHNSSDDATLISSRMWSTQSDEFVAMDMDTALTYAMACITTYKRVMET